MPVGSVTADEVTQYRNLVGEHADDAHLVAFIAESDSSAITYDFTADGAVEFTEAPYESPTEKSIEGGTWSGVDYAEQADGIWKAGGGTGNGYGDAYLVKGSVLSVDIDSPEGMWIELDGERVTPEELVERTASEEEDEQTAPEEPEHLVAVVAEDGSSGVTYDFTAGGPIEFTEAPYESPSGKSIEGGTWSGVDYVEEGDGTWEAGGGTGNGYGDAYLVKGPVLSANLDSPEEMWIELDGERVTPEELIERTTPTDDGDASERVSPGQEVTVQPGTSVMFEVDASGEPEWLVDGDFVGGSLGPWYGRYHSETGCHYWQQTFESEGTYETTAAAPEYAEETYETSWEVRVTSDGAAAPAIDEARPDPDEPLDLDYDGSLEVDVSYADGEVDRVVWWLHQADVILGITDLDEAATTASLSADEVPGCHTCDIYVWLISESGTVVEETPWTFEE